MKKYGLFLLLFILPVLFKSCGCGTNFYRRIDFDIIVLDNSGEFSKIVWDSLVNKKALGFQFPSKDTLIDIGLVPGMDLGMASCYAWSCDPGIEYVNAISWLKVETLNNYSDQYAAGTNITHLFKYKETVRDSSDFIAFGDLRDRGSSIFLYDTTAIQGPHKFQFTILTNDGQVIRKASPILTLR